MELRIFFPMMSMLSSGIFQTGVGSSISARLSRTKRCSCATFLDKECVYFCHLDIIWVNTPERTVSYGLGSVKKRSVEEVSRATEIPRCKCKDSSDSACSLFCHTDKETGHEAAREKVISSADCAEKPRRIKRALKRIDPSGERTTGNGGRGSLTKHKLLRRPPSIGRQGVLHFTKPF